MAHAHVVGTYESTGEESGNPYWWILLITGSLWSIFGIVVFRFDYTSVAALSVLLGTVCMAAAVLEAFAAAAAHGWWRVAHIGLTILFAIVGAVAYIHPGNTFAALAGVFAFYLLLRGVFEIIVSIMAHGTDFWWVGLISGIIQVALAFWAAGDFGHKAILLVVWVGASSLAHGIAEIITAFRIRPPGATPRPA